MDLETGRIMIKPGLNALWTVNIPGKDKPPRENADERSIDRTPKQKRRLPAALSAYNYLFYQISASIFFTKLLLGCAPTSLSTTLPPLINRIAGMEVMP